MESGKKEIDKMKFLKNSSLFLVLGVILAFIIPEISLRLKFLLKYILIMMMTLSLKNINFNKISKSSYKNAFKLISMNYILLPSLILLAMLLIMDHDYQIGFVILAAVPPAIGITPLAYLYKADIKTTIIAQILSYLSAFLILPLYLFIFSRNTINIYILIKSLVLFLILPLILSRFINRSKFKIFRCNRFIVNLLYALLFFIVIGSNYEILTKDIFNVIKIFIIMLFLSFGLALLIFYINKNRKISISKNQLYILFGTFKNTAMGAVLAVVIFSSKVAIPLVIRAAISPFFIIFLNYLFTTTKKQKVYKL